MKLHFSKSDCSDRHSGLFNDKALHGTLEAAVLEAIDNVLPFIGGIVNSFYGTWNKAEVF